MSDIQKFGKKGGNLVTTENEFSKSINSEKVTLQLEDTTL
jgi:hypothetical protein